MTIRATRYPGLGYAELQRGIWQCIDTSDPAKPAQVGYQFKTQAELLAALPKYARDHWGHDGGPEAEADDVRIVIVAAEPASPGGQLAQAEVLFLAGALAGLRLVGFALWAGRAGGNGRVNVTFPARTYSVNGERRSFALLRPQDADSGLDASARFGDRIRDAYEAFLLEPKVPL